MKATIKNIIVVLISFATILVFTRCEKEETLQAGKFSAIVMPQAQSTPNKQSVPIVDTAQTLVYSASYQGAKPADSDISVHFSVNPALADSFNANNVVSYPMLPAGSYELMQKSATIPAGKRSTGNLQIKLNTAGYIKARGKQYLLPVTMNVENSRIPVSKNLMTTYFLIRGRYVNITKKDWSITTDSFQPDHNQQPEKAIDGNENSFWQTQFSPVKPDLPHHLAVDMGEAHTMNGINIVGRLDQSRGNPQNITILFGDDGQSWTDSTSYTGIMTAGRARKKIFFEDPVKARYFKIKVTHTVYGQKFTHIAEITMF